MNELVKDHKEKLSDVINHSDKPVSEEIQNKIPLSFSQERLWFLDKLGLGHQYHVPGVSEIIGQLDLSLMGKAFDFLVDRHESLRTIFVETDNEPCQEILSNQKADFTVKEIINQPREEQDKNLSLMITEFVSERFNLETGPLFRVLAIRTAEDKTVLAINMHHIISDGWSVGILIQEFIQVYLQLSNGITASLPPTTLQYKDYAIWQRKEIGEVQLAKELDHWKNHLKGYEDISLPTDFARPARLSGKGGSIMTKLDPSLNQELKAYSKTKGKSQFAIMLAGIYALLHIYSRQNSINVGIPMANRNNESISGTVGFFVNTVINRVIINPENTLQQLVSDVSKELIRGLEHHEVPFEKIVEAVNPARDQSRTPLFQVMVNHSIEQKEGASLDDLEIRSIDSKYVQAKFDLNFTFIEQPGENLALSVVFSTDLFRKESMVDMLNQYEVMLSTIINSPEKKLTEVCLLTSNEKQKYIYDYNQTETPYPSEKCIHELFEDMVEKTPDNIAIRQDSFTLTYKELNKKANRLAHFLVDTGVKPNELVGVCMDRSVEFLVALMGILKSGAAYLPMGVENPDERISFMIQDSKINIVLTDEKREERVNLLSNNKLVVRLDDDFLNQIERSDKPTPNGEIKPENLIYVIYTSGSTGKPKGVQLEHRSVVNFSCDMAKNFRLPEVEIEIPHYAFFGNISFDATVPTFMTPLISGGSCIVLSAEDMLQTIVQKAFEDDHINAIKLTPSHLKLIADVKIKPSKTKKLVVTGGEVLQKVLVETILAKGVQMFPVNEYGPTECTVASVAHYYDPTIKYNNGVHIGKPIANTQIYILDQNGNPLPAGIPGELHIAGNGLARGYMDRPDLTAEKFIPNPFIEGKRMYKTGDLARWLSDGNLEFISRIDEQIKIRGYRVELGEIESVLMAHEDINLASAILKKQEHDEWLVAYYTADKSIEESVIKEYLGGQLPEYMVPKAFVQVDEMPLTPNAKINKRVLHNLKVNLTSTVTYVAPSNDVERKLCAIWENLLNVDKVGIKDNFFELGGHSLLITKLITRINDEFHIIIPLKNVFESPVLENVAGLIGGDTVIEETIPLEIFPKEGKIPLSFAQERLWFLDKIGQGHQYHIPKAFRISGKINVLNIEKAFGFLIERHDSLRTAFKEENSLPYQVVLNDIDFKIQQEDYQQHSKNQQETLLDDKIEHFANEPFILSEGPLVRVIVIKMEANEHVMAVCMHHIISDGWSSTVITEEFSKVYLQLENNQSPYLEPLPIQYTDYSIWQRKVFSADKIKSEVNHWVDHLEGYEDLSMPTDFSRPARLSGRGKVESILLNRELSEKLVALSRSNGRSPFTILLSGVYAILHFYSRQNSINIGVPTANRNHPKVDKLIGFFVNTVVNRIIIDGEMTFGQLVDIVSEELLRGQSHQDLSFEKIVEAVNPARDESRTPLFQVMANYMIEGEERQDDLKLEMTAVLPKYHQSKFDLNFTFVAKADKQVILMLDYSTDLYSQESVIQMLEQFEKLLKHAVETPEEKIADINLITESTKNTLLSYNQTEVNYPREKSIVQLFAETAVMYPDKIAVKETSRKMVYSELHEKSDQLAGYLIKQGTKKGDLIGICMDRSVELIISVLAILKAGAAYVPMGIENPDDRIAFMTEDSNVINILTDDASSERLKIIVGNLPITVINEEFVSQLSFEKSELEKVSVKADDLAYVIYTSGSTGKPKGVLLEHKGVVNYLTEVSDKYRFKEIDIDQLEFAFFGNISFDATATTFLTPLVSGGTCHVFSAQSDQQTIVKEAFESDEINAIKLTPSHLKLVKTVNLKPSATKKMVVIGGEALQKELVQAIQQKGVKMFAINEYGPTECTIASVAHLFDDSLKYNTDVHIGKPMANTQVYVLNAAMKMLPVGVPGELFIAGDGLARGYHNRAELTAERFVKNPFKDNTRLYKTGDLVRWLPNGNIEFLGRIDEQVKIRGYRVELGEIENVLMTYPSLDLATVVLKDQGSDQILVAFYTAIQDANEEEVRNFLKGKLPEYMHPQAFVRIEEMPLTPNGKVNRKALINNKVKLTSSSVYIKPESETEKTIAAIWEEILKVENIGLNDNFFELGGHSLSAAQCISRINLQFQLNLSVGIVFKMSQVKLLANFVDQQSPQIYIGLEPKERPEKIPLSFSQERIWFLDKMGSGNQYHMPIVYYINGDFRMDILQKAIDILITRHTSLRTNFIEENGVPHQVIRQELRVPVNYLRLNDISEEILDDVASKKVMKLYNDIFDLEKEPLIRFLLIEKSKGQYIFGFCLHHIISDGWSNGLLTKEFSQIYDQILGGKDVDLTEITLEYADYVIWQREVFSGEYLENEIAHWKEHLAGFENLSMPTDYPRPKEISGDGAVNSIRIEQALTEQIISFSKEHGHTSFNTLTAAVYLLLNNYSYQDDILLGTPIANRNYGDLEDIVGLFANTVVLRVQMDKEDTVFQLIDKVKEESVRSQDHQNIPFEKVVEAVQPERELNRTPLFQVLINYQIQSAENGESKKLDLSPYIHERNISKYDLQFSFFLDENSTLVLSVEYSTDLYVETTILKMIDQLQHLLNQIVTNAAIKLKDLNKLPENEINELIVLGSNSVEKPVSFTIDELISQSASRYPERMAIRLENSSLNYRELEEKSNHLANQLKWKKVNSGDLVATWIDRSPELFVSILAIIKAGGIYVPLDPSENIETNLKLIKQLGIENCLIKNSLIKEAKVLSSLNVIDFQSIEDLPSEKALNNPEKTQPDSAAYLLLGTGEQPKAVLHNHFSVSGLKTQSEEDLEENNVISQLGGLGTCLFMQEFGHALFNSKVLEIIPEKIKLNPQEIIAYFTSKGITHSYIATAHLDYFCTEANKESDTANFIDLKNIIVSGDKLEITSNIRKFFINHPEMSLQNQYTTLETMNVVSSQLNKLPQNWYSQPALGKPKAGVNVFLLDSNREFVARGTVGELFLGGSAIAKNYLNNSELTQENYVQSPISDEMLFNTGDLAYFDLKGDLNFVKRIDSEVKIRGFKVRTSKIAETISNHDAIRKVEVISRKHMNNQFIVAFYVSDLSISDTEFKEFISKELPDYMIPFAFVKLDDIPVKASGKVDINQLNTIEVDFSKGRSYIEATGQLEENLLRLWTELLFNKKISVEDNFFDVGGHSLLAIQLISRINEEFNIEMTLNNLFKNPTIRDCAKLIGEMREANHDKTLSSFINSEEELIF